MKFFKYGEKKYSDSLLAEGQIRIGTLYNFRKAEHKPGVTDPMEGKKSVTHKVDHAVLGSGGVHEHAVEAFRAIKSHPAFNVVIQDMVMNRRFDGPDCFVYCGSLELSETVAAEFEGVDACVEVFDLDGFVRCVTEYLSSLYIVTAVHIRPVVYTSRFQKWNGSDWGEHPLFMKDPSFKGQKEIRIVWAVATLGEIAPIILSDPRLAEFCDAVEFSGAGT